MSFRDLYMFEYGSGSTWGTYLVPADAYNLSVHSDGKIRITPSVPTSVDFDGVQNLDPIGSAQFCAVVKATLKVRETKPAPTSAAEDMLDVLKQIRDSGTFECCCGGSGGTCDGTCISTLIKLAIKKAEGK